MSKRSDAWNITVEAVLCFLRRPFSNIVTKTLLFTGAAVFVSPAIEHLVFNALLRDWLGIDLGIEVPGVEAYAFGTLLMSIGAAHNLIFVYLNSTHALNEKKLKVSVYKEFWVRLDCLVDDVARLVNLYCTICAPRDKELAEKVESSYFNYVEYLRENRPFFFSEEFYEDGMEIAAESQSEIAAFWACFSEKKNPNTTYQFHMAEKTAREQFRSIKAKYENLCQKVRDIQIAI